MKTQVMETSDLHMAAWLYALGHSIHQVTGPPDARRFVFVGVSDEDLGAYTSGSKSVPPADLFRAYRQVRRLLGPRH